MSRGIRVSEKHGVNPTISQCYFCGEDKNELLLLGRLPGDKQAPMHGVYDYEPCETCKSYMKQGIILISVKDNDPEYRTGAFVVVTENAIMKMLKEGEMRDGVLKQRCAFLPDTVWYAIGLPRGEQE